MGVSCHNFQLKLNFCHAQSENDGETTHIIVLKHSHDIICMQRIFIFDSFDQMYGVFTRKTENPEITYTRIEPTIKRQSIKCVEVCHYFGDMTCANRNYIFKGKWRVIQLFFCLFHIFTAIFSNILIFSIRLENVCLLCLDNSLPFPLLLFLFCCFVAQVPIFIRRMCECVPGYVCA